MDAESSLHGGIFGGLNCNRSGYEQAVYEIVFLVNYFPGFGKISMYLAIMLNITSSAPPAMDNIRVSR